MSDFHLQKIRRGAEYLWAFNGELRVSALSTRRTSIVGNPESCYFRDSSKSFRQLQGERRFGRKVRQ